MMRHETKTAKRRTTAGMLTLGLALLLGVAGCGDILDVENPNNLTQDDLNNPASAEALANGAVVSVTRAMGYMNAVHSTISDELHWTGSRSAWDDLSRGFLSDPTNEFSDAAFPFVAEARWTTQEAVDVLEAFHESGELTHPINLARAYLYAGVIHTSIADSYEDFAFSDRKEASPPVGPSNMQSVYDQAISFLDRGLTLAQELGDASLVTRMLAQRARALHGRAVWEKLQTINPQDALVSDAQANENARAALDRLGAEDWSFDVEFSSSTVTNNMGSWVNDRSEMAVGPAYVDYSDEVSRVPDNVILQDPIDQVPDPVAQQRIFEEFIDGGLYPSITVVSARELHLILAESALNEGDMTGFAEHINAVRAFDDLTPYSGQVDALELLRHERRVNLMFQMRRIQDHYRFGDPSGIWAPTSAAVNSPGTLLPIAIIEIRANPHIGG